MSLGVGVKVTHLAGDQRQHRALERLGVDEIYRAVVAGSSVRTSPLVTVICTTGRLRSRGRIGQQRPGVRAAPPAALRRWRRRQQLPHEVVPLDRDFGVRLVSPLNEIVNEMIDRSTVARPANGGPHSSMATPEVDGDREAAETAGRS